MARVRLRWNSLLESAAVLGVTAYALGTEIGTYSQLIIQGGGEDGLTYEAYSRDMLLALRSGSWKGFLLGFEQVFYFMPGLRYLISLEKIFFGETHLLGLALLLFLSVLVWRLIGLLVDNKILRIATFCGFLFIDKSARILALDFGNIASYTLWRLTEPWALILLLAALWIVLKSRASREISYIGGLLLGFAVLLRPNIVLIIPAFSILLIFDDERKFSWARLFAFASGLSPILLMLLHNKIFGNEWVLFTTASRIPENQWLRVEDYTLAARHLIEGDRGPLTKLLAMINKSMFSQSSTLLGLWILSWRLLLIRGSRNRETAFWALALGLSSFQGFFWRADGRFGFHIWVFVALILMRYIFGSPRFRASNA